MPAGEPQGEQPPFPPSRRTRPRSPRSSTSRTTEGPAWSYGFQLPSGTEAVRRPRHLVRPRSARSRPGDRSCSSTRCCGPPVRGGTGWCVHRLWGPSPYWVDVDQIKHADGTVYSRSPTRSPRSCRHAGLRDDRTCLLPPGRGQHRPPVRLEGPGGARSSRPGRVRGFGVDDRVATHPRSRPPGGHGSSPNDHPGIAKRLPGVHLDSLPLATVPVGGHRPARLASDDRHDGPPERAEETQQMAIDLDTPRAQPQHVGAHPHRRSPGTTRRRTGSSAARPGVRGRRASCSWSPSAVPRLVRAGRPSRPPGVGFFTHSGSSHAAARTPASVSSLR